MEKSGLYVEALEYLNLYLKVAPDAPDAGQVRTKIYELEYKAKHAR